MKILKRIGIVRMLISIIVIALIGSFIFSKQIQKHRVTRAKIEMMKRMTQTEPKEWAGQIKQVYDSIILERVDTTDDLQN